MRACQERMLRLCTGKNGPGRFHRPEVTAGGWTGARGRGAAAARASVPAPASPAGTADGPAVMGRPALAAMPPQGLGWEGTTMGT
nr:hypothetical protein GCM10020093_006970 [Planobispora longispora]